MSPNWQGRPLLKNSHQHANNNLELLSWVIRKEDLFLVPFAADIAVVQECARPVEESDQCLWFGDNPRQGIAIIASGDYRLRRLPTADEVPNYAFPIEVTGLHAFTLLAIWSKGRQSFPYIEGVCRAVEIYRPLILSAPTVLIGDLNSSLIWDATHPKDRNHSALVRTLSQLGLVSAYHIFYGEAQGAETRPTYYFHWKESRPFHIDYCFVPSRWLPGLNVVEVGSYEAWKQHSDHRPLVVNVSPHAA